jgi:hypothetical protein
MSRRRQSDDDAAMGCVVYALLILFFMPIVGLVMVCGKDEEKKMINSTLSGMISTKKSGEIKERKIECDG